MTPPANPGQTHTLASLKAALASLERRHQEEAPTDSKDASWAARHDTTPALGEPGKNQPWQAQARASARPERAPGTERAAPVEAVQAAGPGRSDAHRQARAKAHRMALTQLAASPKTRFQLHRRLLEKGCDEAAVNEVLDQLTDEGLVDDAEYALMYMRRRHEGRGLARTAVAAELRERGVHSDLIEAALNDLDPEAETERARHLVQRKLATMRGLEPPAQARRLAGMLARKGYDAGIAAKVVLEAVEQLPENRRD